MPINGFSAFATTLTNCNENFVMSRLLFAAASFAVLIAASSSSAVARDYPYCLQGRSWGYPGNCQFMSYQQCEATASGTNAYCGINPRFAFARQPRGHWRRY
jgi:hypothetical protein